jgi:antitoxin component YwqK of YwqJK toxin-antitoxin module
MSFPIINQKSKLILLLLSFIINASIAQKPGVLKVVKKYYDWPKNTRLEEIYTVNSIGQKQGVYKWYNIFSVTTSPEHEGNYKNDMLDGLSKRYYTFSQVSLSGIVKETRQFKEDKKNGKELLYDYVFNGEYASSYTDEKTIVAFIQKGKRVIREEAEYKEDIKLSEKKFHANGKIAIDIKYDNSGELLSEVLTNEEGVVTFENRFDENGNFIKKFKLYPNGKLNLVKERDSTGGIVNKEYYESGTLKNEQNFDKTNQITLDVIYYPNGKIKYRASGLKQEEFFEDEKIKKLTMINPRGAVTEQLIYNIPGKLESKYQLKADGTVFIQKFDEQNECIYQQEVDPNKNSITITKDKKGIKKITKIDAKNNNQNIEEFDPLGKLILKELYTDQSHTKTTYLTNGGFVENINKITFRGDFISKYSQKQVDSTGAYILIKYDNFNKEESRSGYDAKGRKVLFATYNQTTGYDSAGNVILKRTSLGGTAYEEIKYERDGTQRIRNFSNSSDISSQEKVYKNDKWVGVVYYDAKGKKERLVKLDATRTITKEIKIINDEDLFAF